MANPIPTAAIDAAARVLHDRHEAECDTSVLGVIAFIPEAHAALEAAMPHIRKQIASEIRAEAAKRAGTAGWDTAFHNLGLVTAARIAEGENK